MPFVLPLPAANASRRVWQTYWRSRAREARERAAQMPIIVNRGLLLDLANRYDRLAKDWVAVG